MEKGKANESNAELLRFNRSRTKRSIDIRELRGMIRDFAENEEWDELINTIRPMLLAKPRDHWLLVQGAQAYYQKKDFNGALVYSADALTIEFGCPLAQFIFGNALAAIGETQEALEFLGPLMNRSAYHLARGRCGEGSDCNVDSMRAKILTMEARSIVSRITIETCSRDFPRSSLPEDRNTPLHG